MQGRNPGKVIDFILHNTSVFWIATDDILTEYEEVICRRKFNFPKDVIENWLRVFSTIDIVDVAHVNVSFPRDPKDEKFLRCALASDADYLVTGDSDFRTIDRIGKTERISVSQFIVRVVENQK